ncbi:MAG: Gfo/Idh/MocA family protein [Cellulosilyticaceae bacterium]
MAYKLGIIGYGGMGGWHHENISGRIQDIEVVGAFDLREEMLEKAKKNGIKAYESAQELLEDPEIDIVTIATPNDVHKQYVIDCLRAGKHVICEKPVTMNAKELEEIIAVMHEEKKLFSIHQNRRWDKDFRIIKAIYDQNTVGHMYRIESRVQGSRRSLHGWRGYKVNGGGMLFDWGVHMIDQLLWMIPEEVVSVDAHLQNIFAPEVDDHFDVVLRFESGITAVIEVATNCLLTQPRWHVCGADGTVIVEDWDGKGKIMGIKEDSEMLWEDEIVYTSAGPTRTMAPRPQQTTVETALPEVVVSWEHYYQNIIDVLEGKAELIVKPEQALRVMRVIDTAFESQTRQTGIACRI